jgi:hypothetical protein
MQNVLINQILKGLYPLSPHIQAQIRGGSGSCGCTEEKRRSVKVRKPASGVSSEDPLAAAGTVIIPSPVVADPA